MRTPDPRETGHKLAALLREELPGLDPEDVAAAMVRAVGELFPIAKFEGKTLADQPRIECARALMRRAEGPIRQMTMEGHWDA